MQAGAHWPEALFSFSKAACGTSNPYSSSFASEQLGPALARPTSQPPARVHTCSHIRRYDRMHCESPSWSLFWGQADGNGILPRLVVGHSSASASYLVLEIAGLLCARERPLEVANLQPACPRRQERRERNTEEVHNISLKKPGASPQGPRMAVRRRPRCFFAASRLDSLNGHFPLSREHRQPLRSAALASSSILGRIAYFRPTSMLNCTTSI